VKLQRGGFILTGETTQGGEWRKERHGYLSLLLWVHIERGAAWMAIPRKRNLTEQTFYTIK